MQKFTFKTRIQANRRISIPKILCESFGFKEGDVIKVTIYSKEESENGGKGCGGEDCEED